MFKQRGKRPLPKTLAVRAGGLALPQLQSLSSSSYLDILIRELFLSTECGLAAPLAKSRAKLNVRAKPVTHDPGDPGWCIHVNFHYHSRPE